MSLEDIAAEARQQLGSLEKPYGEGQGGPRVEILPPITDQEKAEDEAKEWAGFPYLFGRLLSPVMPELKEVYTEAACLEWGRRMVPVARKYTWTPGGASMWIGLGIATWKLGEPTVAAIKRKRAQNDRTAKPQAEPAREPQAGETATHPDGSPIG